MECPKPQYHSKGNKNQQEEKIHEANQKVTKPCTYEVRPQAPQRPTKNKMLKIVRNNKKWANDVNVISKGRGNARGKTPLEHCNA